MKLVMTLITIYAVVVIAMTLGQRRLMYFPHTSLLAPMEYGLAQVEAAKLETADGESLDIWRLAPKDDMPTILYFHGNGGHLGFRTHFFQAAQQVGYGVMMVSYRGYGKSTGSPSEQGFYADAKAAYVHLRQSVAEEQIILFGESIGTGVVMELARGKSVRAVVLQAPFTSAVQLASEIYPWLPVKMVMKDRFDSISKVSDVKAPVLVLAAREDYIVPLAHSQALFEALDGPKDMVVFDGIGHNDFDPSQVLKQLARYESAMVP